MEHSKHIARVVILVILILVAFPIVRTLFIPRSFGKYGHYRADNVMEWRQRPVVHGESQSCAQCHEDKLEQLQAGVHLTIACEDCHAPLVTHVKKGERIAEMYRNRSFALCLRCHEKLDARRGGFPQIAPEAHLKEASMEMTSDVCLNCHDPHGPKIGG